ncbi:MAG: GGDEF domain-containing protein [Flexilinea sp.]
MMNLKKRTAATDLPFVAMVVLIFIAVYFLSNDSGNFLQNSLILCIVSAIILITYFTSLVFGLIVDAVLIFLLFGYTLINSFNTGIPVSWNIYFWILWSPLMTVAVAMYTAQTTALQSENETLRSQLNKVSMVDLKTGLRNLRDFENETNVYMKISARYNMPLELIVWKLRYQSDLEKMMEHNDMENVIRMISDEISTSLREEDSVFLISDDPYEWAVLLFTDQQNGKIVIDRIQNNIANLNFSEYTKQKVLPIDMELSIKPYDQQRITPLSFLESARTKSSKLKLK